MTLNLTSHQYIIRPKSCLTLHPDVMPKQPHISRKVYIVAMPYILPSLCANPPKRRWRLSSDDTVESLLEPSNSLFRLDLVRESNSSSLGLSSSDSETWSTHDDVEIHTENTDSWVVLDSKINVLLDTETKVSSLGEVSVCQRKAQVTLTTIGGRVSLPCHAPYPCSSFS